MAHTEERDRHESGARGGIALIGVAALMVGCCAAAPLLLVLAGGLAIGALAGVAAGVLALVALAGAVVFLRRRRACEIPPSMTRSRVEGVR